MKKLGIGLLATLLFATSTYAYPVACGGGHGQRIHQTTNCQYVDKDNDGICDNCSVNNQSHQHNGQHQCNGQHQRIGHH